MNIRKFDIEKDYEDVATWWESQGWPVIPPNMLSPSGFITEKDGIKLAATWIFTTNCPIYIMEWTIGNPEASWENRSEGIELVTNEACKWAKEDGAAQVFTMTKNDRFLDKLQSYGFQKTEDGMTHLIRSV